MERSIDMVVCNYSSNYYKIESLQTFDKTQLNGFKIISTKFETSCDTNEDFAIIREITLVVPNLNKLTCMKLSKCDLAELPCAFSELKIRELDLSHNHLRIIPRCFYMGLKDVEQLNLSDNPLSHFDRVPLCYINLKWLNISQCTLKNPPKWIMKCSHMHTFFYNYNKITDLEDYYSPTCNFKHMEFKNSLLINQDLIFFKPFPLEYLDFSNESMWHYNSNLSLEELIVRAKWHSSINVLKCNNLQICDIPPQINALINLEELHLNENALIKLPNEITALQNLKILDISQNSLFSLPSNFNRLQNLEILKASFNTLCAVDFQGMTHLEFIDLYNNEIDEINIDMIYVKHIDLDQNHCNANLLCDTYTKKRDELRLIISNGSSRKSGNKILEESEEYDPFKEWNSSSTEEDSDEISLECELKEEVWECEDLNFAQVSLSDNEFTGKNTFPSNYKRKPIKNQNEDYLFADAD